jgi:uncharacterized protein YbjT (DUF2867 family)
VAWTRQGQVATVPPLLVQPIAAADVGAVLAEIATGAPQGRATDLAGPEPQDLVDMARRTLAARGESIRLIPSWRSGLFGVDAAGEVLLPGLEARLAPTTRAKRDGPVRLVIQQLFGFSGKGGVVRPQTIGCWQSSWPTTTAAHW